MDEQPPPASEARRVSAVVAATAVAVPLGIVAIAVLSMVILRSSGLVGTPFDSATWKASAADSSPQPVRLRTADSLLAQHPLTGLLRAEVTDLLGEPDTTDKFNDYDLVYYLGPEQGFMGVDSEWLVIKLDSNGRVTEAARTTD
jgi:hypothetical protein